jgi:hypothetical protein
VKSAAFLLGVTLTVAAAQQQPVPRDAIVTPTTGTASISGTVVSDATPPEPVRRAVVTLTGPDLKPSRGAITDDDGRFRITGLPVGAVTLTVARAPFITSVYGAKRPGRPGTAITLGAGQAIENLVVRLWRGAVLAGVLRDESGVPVSGIEVTAISARPTHGTTVQTLSNSPATTNELGEFRIFGLEPGTYIVSATPSAGAGGALVALADAEVDRALAALRTRQRPSAQSASTPRPAAPESKPFDYAPVYFPGTSLRSQATTVTLASGDERGGLDFSLQRVATAVVEGVVRRPDGQAAASANVQLTEVAPAGPFGPDAPLTFNTTTGADGHFRLSQVTPGNYRLVARVAVTPPAQDRSGFASPFPTGPTFSGIADLAVSGSDVTGVAVQLEPGLSFSGRLRFEGQSSPPTNLASLRVQLLPPQLLSLKTGSRIDSIAIPTPATAKADGTFQIDNIVPGSYLLRVAGPGTGGTGWVPRSALLGDRDLFDGPLDLARGGGLAGVVINFTDQHTEIAGTLQTADGQPVSDVFVLAFATDRALWGQFSRRVQAVRPSVDGHFAISDLPPGEYRLAAATDIDQGDWEDPAFLDQFIATSVRVTLGEGEKKIQNLTIGARE